MKQKLITTETSENAPCDFYRSNTLQSQIDIQPLATAIYKELEDICIILTLIKFIKIIITIKIESIEMIIISWTQ